MSDEVTSFLRSVEQLKDRRLEEDEARSRELEEQILQEKRERQARRAERARSISPQKSSPANTPPPTSLSHHRYNSSQTSDALKLSSSPPAIGSPRTPRSPTARSSQQPLDGGYGVAATSSSLHTALDLSAATPASASFAASSSPTKENESPLDADSKTLSGAGLSRTPTLSWQRRPPSSGGQASDRPRSRPLSIVAAENAAVRSSIVNASQPSPEHQSSDAPISRDKIAQALSAKDPSWFRQTPDRGLNSAAYRRSQVEDDDRQDLTAASSRLPGLSRGPSTDPDDSTPTPSPALSALSSSLQASIGGKNSPSTPFPPTQKLDPPHETIASPPSGRTSPVRPLSPTKGAGGFVQSAMMKRSDSVKRWSVTSPPGLQRADSVASVRSGLDGPRRPTPPSPTKLASRPGSSQGPAEPANNSRPSTPTRLQITTADDKPKDAASDEKRLTPPPSSSPSKTMDMRRWSPTKTSSWLDAALNKPESPKPKAAPPPNHQPAWMVELNKAKQHKASNPGGADLAQAPSLARKHEVKTGGLMRSSPMGASAKSTPPPASSFPSRSVGPTSFHSPSSSIGSASGKLGAAGGASLTKATTPPKSDFRANLKPRQPLPSDKKDGSSNELQSVFGTLRKAKTQNFVAPDTLKENILRGKTALNVTGGPKPREKKDELKDAILQKKAEFNQAKSQGRGIATNVRAGSANEPLPEGVAKRLELNKTGGSQSSVSNDPRGRRDSSPAIEPVHNSSIDRSSGTPISSANPAAEAATTAASEPVSSPAPSAKAFGSMGRSPRIGGGGASALADRFNPALAGILARGPPAMAPGGGSSGGGDVTSSHGAAPARSSAPSSASTDTPAGPGPQLMHMTKNRARGPRRKAPSKLHETKPAEEEPAPKPTTPKKAPPPTTPKKADIVVPQVISLVDSSRKSAPELAQKPSNVRGSPVVSIVDSSRTAKGIAERPTPSKASVISLVDSSKRSSVTSPAQPSPKIYEQVAAVAAKNSQPPKPVVGSKPVTDSRQVVEEKASRDDGPASQPSSPRKMDVKRMSRFLEESVTQQNIQQPVEAPRPLSPSKTGGARPLPEPRPLSPQKTGGSARPLPAAPGSPRKTWQQATSPAAAMASPASPASSTSRQSRVFGETAVLAASQQPHLKSPAARRIEPPSPALTSPALSSPMRSPTKHAQDVSAALTNFFGPNRPSRNYSVDTADILSRKPQVDLAVNTVSSQLFRLSSDGKKQPVPSHYERVLFEREMYLCPHTFTDESRRKVTEVYFWAGDAVPEAMVQDVQVFLNREARALGGKLVKLRQGKETAEFLLALGGIVTIRRGSSNKYDSLASSMFCGRRFLGQVAFDEVDFAPSSLCSGFPYLITRQGKCYLWKGKGSNVDELSCSRLIGMDLTLMGELAEVEDGKEPAEFWALFDGSSGSKPGSADHWRLKPKYDRYSTRLFCSDPTLREQIVEIHPFGQRDLSPNGIYVLDAFFEMYIIVGRQSQRQYAAFHNALDFAQEYAILAAGMEDRPFVPISTVVLEGIPRDLKSVFRKWSDVHSPTQMASAGTTSPPPMKRGRSLRVVPLTVALQALAD